MLLRPDCIPCTLNMAVKATRRLMEDERLVQRLTTDILKIPAISKPDWTLTAPEVAEFIIQEIVEFVDNPDPFQSMKAEQNQKAIQLYPWLKKMVIKTPDPLYTSVKIAIIGNSIDAMKYEDSVNLKLLVKERIKKGFSDQSFAKFSKKLSESKLVVYLGDNSGEIIFDKVFIEKIKERYKNIDIVYIVRSIPTLNDVTMEEACLTGMDKITSVVENGIKSPFPGTFIKKCSSETQKLLKKADLIISKGGGNFDSLGEEKSLKNVSFMLLAKCFPYCQQFKTTLNAPVLENRYM